ncbi:hypothetical protein EXIGLDRAFT_838138 [Exidia glandulosa HHB12029]|uniref:Uncharacterized protein n=1 Tax=Exidia glandulosa HHB12029 TaxID=1314781 RepID=A0A165G4E9_EXIGL|nr:hypothetical protein EXIGLDRAFT_838138 [Exidia glandulosa HHB12029]
MASMYSGSDGQFFTFSFHGIGVQIVLSSRPDHSPFGVSLDGADEEQEDSYSNAPMCGVAWGRANLPLGFHTVKATAHNVPGRMFFELLSIRYDDGSDLVPSKPQSSATSPPPTSQTPTPSPPPQSSTPIGSHQASSSQSSISPSSSTTAGTTTVTSSTSSISHGASASPEASIAVTDPSGSSPTPPSSSQIESSATAETRGPSRGAIIGIAVTGSLGALLAVFLLALLWRRRRNRRAPAVQSYHYPTLPPYTGVPASGPSTSIIGVNEKRSPRPLPEPEDDSESESLQYMVSPTETAGDSITRRNLNAFSVRLAPEDIDRIAARMHDVFATARLGDSDHSALPPY